MARGTVHIHAERCKGCELCVHACPQHVLHLAATLNARGYHPVQLDETRYETASGAANSGQTLAFCTGCAICALVCPDLVFTVYREPLPQRRAA